MHLISSDGEKNLVENVDGFVFTRNCHLIPIKANTHQKFRRENEWFSGICFFVLFCARGLGIALSEIQSVPNMEPEKSLIIHFILSRSTRVHFRANGFFVFTSFYFLSMLLLLFFFSHYFFFFRLVYIFLYVLFSVVQVLNVITM